MKNKAPRLEKKRTDADSSNPPAKKKRGDAFIASLRSNGISEYMMRFDG